MTYEKISPALAALIFEYLRFPEATFETVNKTRPQPLSISGENKLQTIVEIYCNDSAEIENTELLKLNSDGGKILTGQIELDKIARLAERKDVRFITCAMSADLAESESETDLTVKKAVVAPGRFTPTRIAFVVSSNSQPNSPQEAVLRGWFEAEGVCEITILSPGGGTTRSIQSEVIEGNPTRFGNYHSSKAFLTKPQLTIDGRQEFFINMRPIAPHQFVTGGTWKLTVVNLGESEVNLSLKTWVHGNANKAVFI